MITILLPGARGARFGSEPWVHTQATQRMEMHQGCLLPLGMLAELGTVCGLSLAEYWREYDSLCKPRKS